jgi:anti-anti-sigma factor
MPVIQHTFKAPTSAPTIAFRRKPEPTAPKLAVMIFNGEYDIATAESLRADLNRVRDIPRVVLDFSDVTYVDSKAIHELIDFRNYRAEKGLEREAIVFQSPALRRIFSILNLQHIFHCVSNLSDVVPSDNTPSHLYYAAPPVDSED